MDEAQNNLHHSSEIQNVLPDVVHSKQIATLEGENILSEIDTGQTIQISQETTDVEYVSEAESVSEQIPSNIEISFSEAKAGQSQSHDFLKVLTDHDKTSKSVSPQLQISHSPSISPSAQEQKQSASWNYDLEYSEVHISNESPVNLPISSETSKEIQRPKSDYVCDNVCEIESPKSYSDSLNDNVNYKSNSKSSEDYASDHISMKNAADKSSGSEDIIKLDIRGKGAPRFPLETAKIIFGPPPQCATVIDNESSTIFPILTPLTTDAIKIEEILNQPDSINLLERAIIDENFDSPEKQLSPEKSLISESSGKEQDVLIEEVTIDYVKEKKDEPKSFIPEETMSFSTMTTDYKTICEEYTVKLVHLEEAINQRDKLIEVLTISLQQSNLELKHDIAEHSHSDLDKGQLSDFIRYQAMIKDDTKFYSAVMSGTTSLQSSNGEKDMDREEITVNHSKSDLRSGSGSDDFQTGFENKLSFLLNKFGSGIEDNLRNKLRESLITVLGDEIGKTRLEFDTDVRELEGQMRQNEQKYTSETQRLRGLLSSVQAGNADIDELRKEYEKEMQDLRTFFEEKCSDIKQSYSEEVWRDRACISAGSSDDEIGAGDARKRTRSAELPSMQTSTPVEMTQRQINRKLEQQLEEMKTEHLQYVHELQARHKEEITSLEEQITHLKAHIQTAENTEGNFSFQQDIDLELEKGHIERIRQEVFQQLQDQLKVLLSNPDAEVSSWPLELVVLRDKIHADKCQENELSSLRDEVAVGEADQWRQKRNNSFDQNRHLEEVTKERDGLKRVAAALQRAFSQLVAYCATAEDELNRTVLAQLLPKLLPHDSTLEDDSRPSTPDLSTSLVSRGKHVHFAPDLDSILGSLDEEGVLGFLQQQRDLSAELKKELEHSLRRLRHEAQELLDLSNKLALNKQNNEPKMLEASGMQITELVEEIEMKHRRCDNCELLRKSMEEAMSECLQRENLLRSELESALTKVAHLMTLGDRNHSDVIVEGYGTGGVRASSRGTGWCSLDDATSPRHSQHEFDALLKERDDLQQQLEAANRQLKSTRQFVEEQAGEREAERDEFAKRLSELREDNSKLSGRLQSNSMILSEVEQLENQTRELNQMIAELETKKVENDKDLKAAAEEMLLLRDIIAKLEAQLEQKNTRETEVLEQLEQMRRTIDERDSKMRVVLGELESLRSERVDISEVTCARCAQEEDRYAEYVEKIKEQARWLEEQIHRRTRRLERTHEICSQPTSEPSEDVSIRDQKVRSPDSASPRRERLSELSRVWEGVEVLSRAEDAVLKRVNDLEMQRAHLNEIAQEVRAERDVLQARMSEQALKISSLSARLQQHRNDAEALAHTASSQLSVQLHDAQAEVGRLKEELAARDKQLSRLKQSLDEKDNLGNQHAVLYGNSCNPKDKVIILERELSSAQARIAHLEDVATQLQVENDKLQNEQKEHQALLLDKEEQLNQIMALKLEEEQNQRSDAAEGKTSGRTLSDIVSISDYDEQDLQMRRTELKNQHISFTAPREGRGKPLNKTLPPDVQRPNMSSLNIDNADNFELYTPRAESLPVNFTYTPTKDKFKRNVNDTTVFRTIDKFGESVKHSTAQKIPDNCSLYPNQNISVSNNVCVEPKKINFSLEASNQHEYTSLEELGITVDMKQENFSDILSQLKHEVKKSRTELTNCKMELKNAEEQLGEFPALKKEVEELKCLLENTMATMQKDKTFYESQLENFSSNKKILDQKLSELTQEVSEKSKDLNLLKEDILRRENMILELAKEKRYLNAKISELENRINDLQNKNTILENSEAENQKLRDRISELDKLEQLVSEKNQQIDSLNQHLDRLDDLQRCLNNKTDEAESLKVALDKKAKELFQVQDSILGLNRDIAKVVEENDQLNNENKELKLNLSKLEKEQENASLKLQNSESELERVSALNDDLTAKIEELKLLTEQLQDKNTEIEILNEDINSYHNEIASLKEQLKMVSRSPSPKSKNGEEKRNDRQANSDKKQLAKIKKQISLLQHELDFHKKELNDKAFELAKAKLDVTELKSNLSEAKKKASDLEMDQHEMKTRGVGLQKEVTQLQEEKQQLAQQLQMVLAKLREESNISELKQKLKAKTERCRELETELENMRDLVERLRDGVTYPSIEQREGARSPTAELESALRQQVHHSRTLDEDIMERILSASSDDREDIPRLALNSSKSSSVQSSSAERHSRLRASCDTLQLQVDNLQARLADKDALIQELQRIRDKLTCECEGLRLRGEAQSDNSARLQLLLDAQQDTAAALQKQDSSMISMLKRRLEGAMKSELELRDKEQQLLNRIQHLESRTKDNANDDRLAVEVENVGRLKGEVRVLKSKLEMERTRYNELQSLAEAARQQMLREADARTQMCVQLKTELAELRRLKHEASVELVRAKELLNIQKTTISQLKQELTAAHRLQRPAELDDTRFLMESPRPRAQHSLLTPSRPPLNKDEKESAIRLLQGRCLRLESWRKALVWQKRYLQRVLSGFYDMERGLMPAESAHTPRLRGKRRFRCIVSVVVAVIRVEYLVRRRHHVRSVAAVCLLREVQEAQTPINAQPFSTPVAKSFSKARALNLGTPTRSSPLAARLLRHDLAAELPQEQGADHRRASYHSPRQTRYLLSSPRAETASAYLNKLDTVSRCLDRTLDKDVP